jgi:hypothetical protein
LVFWLDAQCGWLNYQGLLANLYLAGRIESMCGVLED